MRDEGCSLGFSLNSISRCYLFLISENSHFMHTYNFVCVHVQDYGNGGGLIGVPSGSTTGSATNPSSSSGGGVGGGSGLGSLMPILGAAGINSSAAAVATAVAVIDGVHDSVMEGLGAQELDFTTATAAGGGGGGGEAGGAEEDEGQPPTKKM